MIKNSFLKFGISKAMGGLEDDALFVDNAGDLEDFGGDQADDEAHIEDNDYKEDQFEDVPDESYNELFDD